MAKGLNKAERHEIKGHVRRSDFLTSLRAFREHCQVRRAILAEVRKRRWFYDDRVDCWHKRARSC